MLRINFVPILLILSEVRHPVLIREIRGPLLYRLVFIRGLNLCVTLTAVCLFRCSDF